MKEQKLEYLSEEELEKLIQDVEGNFMIQAPLHLKNEILEQVQKRQEPEVKTKLRSRERQTKLLFYRLKVGFTAAAAIVMLIFLPNIGNQIPQKVQEKSFTSRLAETSDHWCNQMNRFSDMLLAGSKKEI